MKTMGLLTSFEENFVKRMELVSNDFHRLLPEKKIALEIKLL
jgi:hypothetical protein